MSTLCIFATSNAGFDRCDTTMDGLSPTHSKQIMFPLHINDVVTQQLLRTTNTASTDPTNLYGSRLYRAAAGTLLASAQAIITNWPCKADVIEVSNVLHTLGE